LPAYPPSIQPGEHQVEDDEGRFVALDQFQGLQTIGGDDGLKPFPLQVKSYQRSGPFIILYD
jgi:hypothetical protein